MRIQWLGSALGLDVGYPKYHSFSGLFTWSWGLYIRISLLTNFKHVDWRRFTSRLGLEPTAWGTIKQLTLVVVSDFDFKSINVQIFTMVTPPLWTLPDGSKLGPEWLMERLPTLNYDCRWFIFLKGLGHPMYDLWGEFIIFIRDVWNSLHASVPSN